MPTGPRPLSGGWLQHQVMGVDVAAKGRRQVIPNMKIRHKRKIAFVQSILEVGDGATVGVGAHDDEIKVGFRSRSAFDPGAIDPDCDAWDDLSRERKQNLAMGGQDVNRGFHRARFPVIA